MRKCCLLLALLAALSLTACAGVGAPIETTSASTTSAASSVTPTGTDYGTSYVAPICVNIDGSIYSDFWENLSPRAAVSGMIFIGEVASIADGFPEDTLQSASNAVPVGTRLYRFPVDSPESWSRLILLADGEPVQGKEYTVLPLFGTVEEAKVKWNW